MNMEIIDKDLWEQITQGGCFTFLPLMDDAVESNSVPMLKLASVSPGKQEENIDLEPFKNDPTPYGAYILSLW